MFHEVEECPVGLPAFGRSRQPYLDGVAVGAFDLRPRRPGNHTHPQGCTIVMFRDRIHGSNVPDRRPYLAPPHKDTTMITHYLEPLTSGAGRQVARRYAVPDDDWPQQDEAAPDARVLPQFTTPADDLSLIHI